MTKIIEFEVDAKIWVGKKCKNLWNLFFLNGSCWPRPKTLDPICNHILKDFCLNFMKMVNKNCLAQQMTKKIAVEVDAKICFGKKCKNMQKSVKKNFNAFLPLSKKFDPIWNHILKDFCVNFMKMVNKRYLTHQKTQ